MNNAKALDDHDSGFRFSLFSVCDHHPALPRSVPELYGELLDQAVHAEALGYDTYFVAEHHFHEYGVIPNPAVFLATLAQRTTRIRLGTGISVLTFHDPKHVAESYAMLDALSGGRLMYGVGSGYLQHEFDGHDRDPAEKRDQFNENLDIVKRLMAGETITYEGAYSGGRNVRLNVLPHEGRVPPMYVGVLARPAAYHVGLQRNNLFTVPYASCEDFDDIGTMIGEFRKGQAEAGTAPSDDDHIVTLHMHVAESDAVCADRIRDAYDLYVRTRLYAKEHTYDDIIANGICLFGSAETVADKMVRLYEMGVRHVSCLYNFGALSPAMATDSIRRFAEDVMPGVYDRIGLA